MADDKTLTEAREALKQLTRNPFALPQPLPDPWSQVHRALDAFERLQVAFIARPVQKPGGFKLNEDSDGHFTIQDADGEPWAEVEGDYPEPIRSRAELLLTLLNRRDDERPVPKLASDQESSFHPDWSMLEATRGSLREHMALAKGLQAEIAAKDKRIAELEGALERIVAGLSDEAHEAEDFIAGVVDIATAALSAPPDSGKADASSCPPGFVSEVVWQQRLAEMALSSNAGKQRSEEFAALKAERDEIKPRYRLAVEETNGFRVRLNAVEEKYHALKADLAEAVGQLRAVHPPHPQPEICSACDTIARLKQEGTP